MTASDGTVSSVRETSDARFGLARAMRETILQLPSSLSYKVERTRTVSGSTVAENPFAYAEETSRVVVNGNVWRESYTPSTRTRSFLSPESRQVTLREDAVGRVTQLAVPGRQTVNYVYDANGRLETTTQGTRITRLAYGSSGASAGYLESVTNALGERITFGRDGRGRTIVESYADNAQTSFGWDDNDNLLTVVPPGRPAHAQTYTDMDELESSIPPVVPSVPDPVTTYGYDLDGKVTREIRPDGSILTTVYDSAGRPESLTLPTGTVTYAYYPNTTCTGCAPGRLMNVSGPSAISVDTEYDGQLVIGNTWSGDVQGGLRWAHDNNFRIVTETASGASADLTLSFRYDRDGLQTCASPTSCTTPGADALRYTYNGANQPSTTALGNATVNYTYNAFGEVATADATYAGSPLLSIVYDTAASPRDALGRIHLKTEIMAGLTTSWQYAYDARNRLASVTKDGVLTSQYGYDDNGNRLFVTTAEGTLESVYDNQDRLMSLGPLAFAYRESGELKNKLDTNSGALTSYVYDALGNLIAVTLPDESEITYVVDGRGRRVGKSVDGVLVQALLYRDQLRVAAELNAAGEVVSQFIYTGVDRSPDAMASGGQMYRFIKDQVGSVRLVVNAASGEIAQAIQYDEFGVVLEDTNPGFQPFGFAGGLYDGDTGLVRFGARDYDPTVGRWTSKDPSLWRGRSANLYVYSWNDPVNFLDATGRAPFWSEQHFIAWLNDRLDNLANNRWHRNRNFNNRCPPSVPNMCDASNPDDRTWDQDSWGTQKWRGSDGSECVYDDGGELIPDGGTYNYCPSPFTPCHGLLDVAPHFLIGGDYTKTQP